MRDMRRPSRNYISTIRYRFRMAQVAVNAIALLAIGGGLAAYFNGKDDLIILMLKGCG